jgi:hypothetical protein
MNSMHGKESPTAEYREIVAITGVRAHLAGQHNARDAAAG